MALHRSDQSCQEASSRESMTEELRARIVELRSKNRSIRSISRELGIWPNSITWALNHGRELENARLRRRESGARAYRCRICGGEHNVTTHGVQRP